MLVNITVYLNDEQDVEFKRGKEAAQAMGVSVGKILVDALKSFADEHAPAVKQITRARAKKSK